MRVNKTNLCGVENNKVKHAENKTIETKLLQLKGMQNRQN